MAKRKAGKEALTIGSRLRNARLLKGLDVGEAARQIGVPKQTWNNWEEDLLIPNFNQGEAAAKLLGASGKYIALGEQ